MLQGDKIHRRFLPLVILMALLVNHGVLAAEAADSPKRHPDAAYATDLATFKRLRHNLWGLTDTARQRTDLFAPKPADDTTLLRPEMRQQILSIWYPLLDNYMTLDALLEKYMGFYRLKTKKERKRAFHLARGMFLTQYRIALDIITILEQNPVVDTILNEAAPPLGLPQGVYAQFKRQYLNIKKAGRYAALEAVAKAYKSPQAPQLAIWSQGDSQTILAAGKGPGPRMTFKNGISIIQKMGHKAWFPVQKSVAEWMGHTKVYRPHQYLIQPEQIADLSKRLQPGDILLERREWYLTNVGIPGFWTHAALFIGNAAQRDAFSQEPEVKAWLSQHGVNRLDDLIKKRYPRAWSALQSPFRDGHPSAVIEAISPGVTLTSLVYSATCDSLAVLRPRLSKTDRAAAVVRAMRYHGHPYDYDFDFGSDRRLVCTELIVKSYLPGDAKKGLQFPLERIMGRMITPANAFVKQFDRAYATSDQQLDMVLFLDGSEKGKSADETDVATFRRSWKRPKWHILIEYSKRHQD